MLSLSIARTEMMRTHGRMPTVPQSFPAVAVAYDAMRVPCCAA